MEAVNASIYTLPKCSFIIFRIFDAIQPIQLRNLHHCFTFLQYITSAVATISPNSKYKLFVIHRDHKTSSRNENKRENILTVTLHSTHKHMKYSPIILRRPLCFDCAENLAKVHPKHNCQCLCGSVC